MRKYFIIIVMFCLILHGCTKETGNNEPLIKVNEDIITVDVYDSAREEYAYSKFTDTEIIEGLILETIVLQQQHLYSIKVSDAEVMERYTELQKIDAVYLDKVMEKYTSEEMLKEALYNKIVYERVEGAINKEFEGKYTLDEDILRLRTQDYVSQYELAPNELKEFSDAVYTTYYDIELTELQNLYFEAKQYQLVDKDQISSEKIDTKTLFLSTIFNIYDGKLLYGDEEYELREISSGKVQQLFGDILYISNEIIQKNASVLCAYEPQINLKAIYISYDGMEICSIISPRISLLKNATEFSQVLLTEDESGIKRVEVMQTDLGIMYSIEGIEDHETLLDILTEVIPYRKIGTDTFVP